MQMRSSIFKKKTKKNFIPIFIKEIQRFQVFQSFHFTLSKPYHKDKTASVYII